MNIINKVFNQFCSKSKTK